MSNRLVNRRFLAMREVDIRPAEVFKSYLSLCDQDCITLFQKSDFLYYDCPCCDNKEKLKFEFLFSKFNFQYHLCQACKSISVNPRPTPKSIQNFYQNGSSVAFWASDFYKITSEKRKALIVNPKAQRLINLLSIASPESKFNLLDIGAGFGILLSIFRESQFFEDVVAIEPSPMLFDHLKNLRFKVIQKFVENLNSSDIESQLKTDSKRVFVCHELVEHLLRPIEFFSKINSIMRVGDFFNFTTLVSSGFDISYLLEESTALTPPHHLSFFHKDALHKAIENVGFEIIDFSTPGELDVDIVTKSEKFKRDNIMKMLMNTEKAKKEFQSFLQSNTLSSHVNVLLRKK